MLSACLRKTLAILEECCLVLFDHILDSRDGHKPVHKVKFVPNFGQFRGQEVTFKEA